MKGTRSFYVLSLLTILDLVQDVFCTGDFVGFRRLQVLDGRKCPANHEIEVSALNHDKKCSIRCSELSLCRGVFLEFDSIPRCVMCSAQFFTLDDTQHTSSIFYNRLGSSINSAGVSVFHVATQSLTWHASEQYCNDLGGHLASIKSAEENEYVVNITLADNGASIWAGGKGQGGLADTFEWPDGSKLADGYTNWSDGQPQHPSDETACIVMFIGGNYLWGDYYCDETRRGLCKFE